MYKLKRIHLCERKISKEHCILFQIKIQRAMYFQRFHLGYNLFQLPYLFSQSYYGTGLVHPRSYKQAILCKFIKLSRFQTFTVFFFLVSLLQNKSKKWKYLYSLSSINKENHKWIYKLGNLKHVPHSIRIHLSQVSRSFFFFHIHIQHYIFVSGHIFLFCSFKTDQLLRDKMA